MGALEHAAAWCVAKGEPFKSFQLIADLWVQDPKWAEAEGWQEILDLAKRMEADRARGEQEKRSAKG